MAVWIVAAMVFIVFLPIYVCGFARFDDKGKRLTFNLSVFCFCVFGGYGCKNGNGYYIHTRSKKAKSVKKKDFNLATLQLLKAFSIKSVKTVIKVTQDEYCYLPFVSAVEKIFRTVIITNYPLLDLSVRCMYGRIFTVGVKIETFVSVASISFVVLEGVWEKIKRIWLKAL